MKKQWEIFMSFGWLHDYMLLLAGIVQNLATSASPGNLSRVLLLLSFMTVSQEGFDSISDMTFESLARIPNFITELSLITQKMPQARKFGCIVAYCAAKKGVEQDDYIDLLEQIVELIDISKYFGKWCMYASVAVHNIILINVALCFLCRSTS